MDSIAILVSILVMTVGAGAAIVIPIWLYRRRVVNRDRIATSESRR